MDYGWLSVIPPLLAILLAIITRQVFVSLFLGILAGWIILSGWSFFGGLAASIQSLVDVFQDPGNTRVIIFCALIGALITLTQRSGGVQGFVDWLQRKNMAQTPRGAAGLAGVTGFLIFIESSICCLIAGSVSRPLFERLHISREKLAYILDSTSAPKCVLIPLNAWGAFVIGLLETEGLSDTVQVFVRSIPFNFYAILVIMMAAFIIITFVDFGPMKKAEHRARTTGKTIADNAVPMVSDDVTSVTPREGIPFRAYNMLLPVAVMLVMMPAGLYITGGGDIMSGTGSTAVLWSVLAAITVAGVMPVVQRILTFREVFDLSLKGIGGMMPLAIVMMLAFSIGDTSRELGTGIFVASLADDFLHPQYIAAVIFLASAFIAFSTGTSWGVFAIMIPIAVPTALVMDVNVPLCVAAVLGGGVFGDHVSPISDTTLVSSMAAASDHIDHVRTQLPYAMVAAAGAFILYLVAGILLH
ncbi:MAG: Na+/H+ antiporter NhaC family protein [Marinilabiliales bacterium]|nr:MAG: Na+/H+ antiporter NhaC family protein [Marinilabiliales bacterium]